MSAAIRLALWLVMGYMLLSIFIAQPVQRMAMRDISTRVREQALQRVFEQERNHHNGKEVSH